MSDVLAFVFESIWHFLGTLILLCVFIEGVGGIIKAIKQK